MVLLIARMRYGVAGQLIFVFCLWKAFRFAGNSPLPIRIFRENLP